MGVNQSDQITFGEGWVWHSRPESKTQQFGFSGRILKRLKISNTFRYPIFNLVIPVHSSQAIKKLNENSILSVSSKNYLDGKDGDFKENFIQFIKTEFNYSCDQVYLQTLPRVLGYVFNPVSFWYCLKNGKMDAVVCEVNNTFGDRHFYFIKDIQDESANKQAAKRFHVSPFMDLSGYYTFEFNQFEDGNQSRICLYDAEDQLKIDTLIRLKFRKFEEISNSYILKKYGWITVMVIWRIHFQALKLWLKGAKFYTRPQPPQKRVTYDSTNIDSKHSI